MRTFRSSGLGLPWLSLPGLSLPGLSLLWLGLLWLGLLCFGPRDAAAAQTAGAAPSAAEAVVESVLADPDAACPNRRWIGISQQGTCPAPLADSAAGWQVQPLFPGSALGGSSPLDSFCLYEHAAIGNTVDLPKLVAAGALQRVERDCAGVSGSAKVTLADALGPDLEDFFLQQAGKVPGPIPATQGVRLAFLDTSPTEEDAVVQVGASKHGTTMTHLARKLLCQSDDPATCGARVTTRLALPITEFHQDAGTFQMSPRGGHFGTLGQLATAIRGETQRWTASAAEDRLILNLSVAWKPEAFGGLEDAVDDMTAPVQAVYRALEDAACRGALVLAAAGNRSGGPLAGSGLVLPAAWQHRRAPGPAACSHLEGLEASQFAPKSVADPLLYAVAGVDSTGSPLANVRPGAVPPLAAFGDHAVTTIDAGKGWTGTYTGSSVATTVVSATAAAVWGHRKALRRDQLMQLLYASGDPLGRSAEAYSGQVAPEVRRVALCAALRDACDGGDCAALPVDGLPNCEPWAAARPSMAPTVQAFAESNSWLQLDASSLSDSTPSSAPCGAAVHHHLPDQKPALPCPADQLQGIADHPWTGPQPDDIPCPSCPVVKDPEGLMASCPGVAVPYTLHIAIEPAYAGGDLTSTTLRIGQHSFSFPDVDADGLQPGDQLVIQCIEGAQIKKGTPVTLSFQASLHGMTINPVLVVQ